MQMTTYDVVAMGNKIGMLEIVVNCNTVANIMKDETKANSTVKVRVTIFAFYVCVDSGLTTAIILDHHFQARTTIREAFDTAFSYNPRVSLLKWFVMNG